MLARLSFTDFDGQNFMKNFKKDSLQNEKLIENLAPKIVEGVSRLKKWSETI